MTAACASSLPTVVQSPDPPVVLSVTLNESPGPLLASLSVSLDEPGPIEVDYWTDTTPRLRVAREGAASYDILLARLIPDADYKFSIRSSSLEGEGKAPVEGQFSTGGLPVDLAAVKFAVDGEPTLPLTVLELRKAGPSVVSNK